MNNHSNEDQKLLDHEYDGIKELDNPLPGWWLATFYITILFAVLYFAYYEMMGGPTLDEELNAEMERMYEIREVQQESVEVVDEDKYVAMLDNKNVLEQGRSEYLGKCMACHGNNAQGLIGPNLTDEYWIRGDGSVSAIVKIINEGVPEKGMPPWKGVIKPDMIENVAVYVYSLHGSDPPGAKPPQGEKVEY